MEASMPLQPVSALTFVAAVPAEAYNARLRHIGIRGSPRSTSAVEAEPAVFIGTRPWTCVGSGILVALAFARRNRRTVSRRRQPSKRMRVVVWQVAQQLATGSAGTDVLIRDIATGAAGHDRPLESGAGRAAYVGDGSDIVQFDSAVYYCEEAEQKMSIDVTRLGTMEGIISVDYHTEDGSAIAGDRYEACCGTLVFQPGEVFKSIVIPILDGEGWNTTLEFKVRLSNPKHCELGIFLHLCRVKVIDKDTFPTNRFEKEIKAAGARSLESHGVSGIDLFVEWCKLNLTYEGIASRSLLAFGIDQLHNLYFLLTTYCVKYLTDDVFGASPELPLIIPGNKDETILVVAAIYVIPLVGLNCLDLWKAQFGIAERSRSELQANIFRKFMNYDERSRSQVPPSELSLLMVQDVGDIVDSGFMNIFTLAKAVGKLAVSSYFILASSPNAAGALFVFGAATSAFVAWRYKHTVALRERVSDEQAAILEVVHEGVTNYRLIADYFIRPRLQERLEVKIQRLNDATRPVLANNVTADYFPNWLTTVLVTGWMCFGSAGVMDGSMQVGTYLATITVFKEVGDSFQDIFVALLEASKALGPIQKATTILNLRTNLMDLKTVNRRRRARTKEMRTPQLLAEFRRQTGVRYGTDAIPIIIDGVSFTYPGSDHPCIRNVNMQCQQGDLVAVVGPRRGGKATFMKLLGQVLIPTEGQIFNPSYLRVLHVSAKPILLSADIWENLTLGRQYWKDEERESQRVIDICTRLGCSRFILNRLTSTRERFLAHDTSLLEDKSWSKVLSSSDVMLIHLARALIYSPEILVLNRPTETLSSPSPEIFYELLTEFVEKRGVNLPAEGMSKRRPRTAFVSFARLSGAKRANRVWMVKGGEVEELDREALDQVDIGDIS